MGERNFEDSRRKSDATRAGLKRRKAAGKPVGAIPEGYRVETTVADGKAVTRRVVDRARAAIVARIMDGLERGYTPGELARALNHDGLRTRQGKSWSARAVREIASNPVYTGAGGYPQLIDQDRHGRVLASISRLDPVAAQARKGGRPSPEPYLLRGIVHCFRCDTALYTKRLRGERHYLCGAVREARGTCDARPIPAAQAERAVLDHLHGFVGDARAWLAEQARRATDERQLFAETLESQRGELRRLALRTERAYDSYYRLLDQGDDGAPQALKAAERAERDADDLSEALAAAEGRLTEWPAPDVDEALDRYARLRDAIVGVACHAATVEETNAALRSVIQSALLEITVGGVLRGRFDLHADRTGFLRGDGFWWSGVDCGVYCDEPLERLSCSSSS
jgi:Recombinase/Recombinase zinc beta ribbon domain